MPTTKKTKKEHVCSECLELFESKNIYSATKPGEHYSTFYCKSCLDLLKIENFKPYLKPRTKKAR